MKKSALFIAGMLAPAAAMAIQPVLSVKLGGIENGQPIPSKFAYCMPDGKGKTKDGGNINPSISWSAAPSGTKSFAVIVVDKDVPAKFDDMNQEGKTITNDFPRQDFYHWVLVDIPPTLSKIDEGQDSKGMTPGGKEPGKTTYGVNGANDYALKAGMGKGGGYDGNCPPWNDERLHHYYFRVYALDVPSLNLSGSFSGKQAEDAMAGHILAQGEVVGTYTNKL